MLTSFFRFLTGYVRVKLGGYSPERFLNLCRAHQIVIWDLKSSGLNYEMNMSIRDFRRLGPLRKKSRSHLSITERHGLPFFLHRYRNRKMFPVGILLCVLLLHLMSLSVWNIHIEGNHSRSTEVILDYLASEGVVHGMKKNRIDCSEIQSKLRIEFPDIIWVSAEVRGTRLLIRIKENMDSTQVLSEEEEAAPRDVVAARSGLITSLLVRQGIAQVQVGDEVEKGSLLASGRIDIRNDSGEVIDYQYTVADADIYARTSYVYADRFLLSHQTAHPTGKTRCAVYVRLGNHRLALGSKPNSGNYRALSTEYPAKLTENFYLPLTFGTVRYEEYEIYTEYYSEEEAKILAESNFNEFLEKLMQKGVQIVENNVKIEVGRNLCVTKGTISAVEQIGSGSPTELLEVPLPKESITDHSSGIGTAAITEE